MSLQRVFESARKLGVPVVITDPAGREPMVVMPLEQFEAMNDIPSQKSKVESRKSVTLDERTVAVDEMLAEQAAEAVKTRMEETIAKNPEISLEERFYLEPVDDETAI